MKVIQNSRGGFTLVELLIVITLIGILAVGVLAAINPIEQFDKANDTNRKTDAAQLLNAIERYYTNMGYYPWNTSKTEVDNGAVLLSSDYKTNTSDMYKMLQNLINQGELKDSFAKRVSFTGKASVFDRLVILKVDGKSIVKVCFAPKSKAMLKQVHANNSLLSNAYSESTIANSITTLESFPTTISSTVSVTDNKTSQYMICMPE